VNWDKEDQLALNPDKTNELLASIQHLRSELRGLSDAEQSLVAGLHDELSAAERALTAALPMTHEMSSDGEPQAVFEAEEYLRMILENIRDYAIFALDLNNRITSWNTGAERVFGFTESEALGQSGAIVFTPEDRERGQPEKEMAQALANGMAEDERWHIRKDGSRFFASGMMHLMLSPSGQRRGFIKVARDITERKLAEEALQRANEQAQALAAFEERQRLARDLHDSLSQTLFASSTVSESLVRLLDQQGGEALVPHLDRLHRLNQSALSDLRMMLWELRPEQLVKLSFGVELQELIVALKGRKEIEVDEHVEEQAPLPPDVQIAFYRITQEAFTNIIKHATATRIQVSFVSRPEYVELHIEDNGVGFDTREIHADMGMGLQNMRERAALIGASIEIRSEKGAGMQLTVRWERTPFATGD
jgi:PAS domain S-box-containing protein